MAKLEEVFGVSAKPIRSYVERDERMHASRTPCCPINKSWFMGRRNKEKRLWFQNTCPSTKICSLA